MRCDVLLLYYYILQQYYYYNNVRVAHEAAHGRSRAETRAGPCTICTNRSRKAVYCCCEEAFSRSEIPSAYQVKVGTTMWYYSCNFLDGKCLDERLCALTLRLG